MIDERPIHMRTDSADRTKWKAIGGDTDSDRVKSPELPEQQQQKTERKTLAGKKAGLSDAKEIKKELVELKKRNEKAMSKLNDDISGKNAKTVFRDRKTGKSRGFAFLCYQDQRSTILAVDNFNGIKLLNRIIRVDHVEEYKIPKEFDDITNELKELYNEGCAPKPIEQPSNPNSNEIHHELNENPKKSEHRLKDQKRKKQSRSPEKSSRSHHRHSSSSSKKHKRRRIKKLKFKNKIEIFLKGKTSKNENFSRKSVKAFFQFQFIFAYDA